MQEKNGNTVKRRETLTSGLPNITFQQEWDRNHCRLSQHCKFYHSEWPCLVAHAISLAALVVQDGLPHNRRDKDHHYLTTFDFHATILYYNLPTGIVFHKKQEVTTHFLPQPTASFSTLGSLCCCGCSSNAQISSIYMKRRMSEWSCKINIHPF